MNKNNLKHQLYLIPKTLRFFLLFTLFSQSAFAHSEAPSFVPPALQLQRSLTGWLTVVWGDGGIEEPKSLGPLFYLTTDDQQRFLIQPTPEALNRAGGMRAVDRKLVSINGTSSAEAIDTPVLVASNIELLTNRSDTAIQSAVNGTQKFVNILCRFKDIPITPHPVGWFAPLFANIYPGLDHYWREASYNRINLTGTTTVGWFNLPKNQSVYVDSNGILDLGLAAEDCTAAADAQVFFPDYVGINLMFNDSVGNFAWGGGWCLIRDGLSNCWNMTWLPPWGYENQSPMAHEMGHSFGLPHSSGPYGQTYDSSWDVMSNTWSCTTVDPNYGCLGQHTISYHKSLLGWIPGVRKLSYHLGGAAQMVHITNITNGLPSPNDYLMGKVQLSSGKFYTVEARLFTGYDGVARIPGEAIVIHKVTPGQNSPAIVLDASNNGEPNDAGAMWVPGESFIDKQNGLSITIGQKTSTGYYVTFAKPIVVNFIAPFQYDGTIVESAPDSGTGGATDAQSAFLLVGDDVSNRQLCSILLFTTASLPDNAKIILARLSLQRAGVAGSPSELGPVWVDVHRGALSNNLALQSSDFEAPATAENHKYLISNGKTYATNIKPEYISQKGATQFRLCHSNDDVDSLDDYIKFYSGNAAEADRPLLIITYYLP